MNVEELYKEFSQKYSGAMNEELNMDVDAKTAITKYLLDETLNNINRYFENVRTIFKYYFSEYRTNTINAKTEELLLTTNRDAFELVREALILWKITDDMLPKD